MTTTLNKFSVCAGLVAAFISMPSHAADSVVLSGILDSGLGYTSNVGGKALYSTVNGVQTSSNIHFLGSEDLGAGYSAIFALYTPFSVQTGVTSPVIGNKFFNVADVGIKSDKYGSLTMGRQWDPTADQLGKFSSVSWLGYFTSHTGDADNLNITQRNNNSIKYTSTSFYGVTVSALYALSQDTDKRELNLALSYQGGAWGFGLGYFNLDRSDAGAANNAEVLGYGQYGLTRFDASPNLTAVATHQKAYLSGASYTIGSVTLGASYSYLKYDYANSQSLGLFTAEANLRYQLNAANRFTVSYNRTAVNAGPNDYRPSWDQINTGLEHWLSKRTNLYAIAIYQRVGGEGVSEAQIFGSGKSSNNHQFLVLTGMRHLF